jgi:hypothetical protein
VLIDQEGTAMISATVFDRLVEMGRRRGALQSDDLRQALPVDTMTTEEIVDVVTRLEDAGIAVEIDPALLKPRHRKMPSQVTKTAAVPSPDSARPAPSDGRLSGLESSITAARGSSSQTTVPAGKFVKPPSTTSVLVVALILLNWERVCQFRPMAFSKMINLAQFSRPRVHKLFERRQFPSFLNLRARLRPMKATGPYSDTEEKIRGRQASCLRAYL